MNTNLSGNQGRRERLFEPISGFALIFLLIVLVFPTVGSAQGGLEGRLPRLFNRDRPASDRPQPINRDTPDIVFIRDFGIPTPRSVRVETVKGLEVTFYISAETKTPGMTVEFLVRDFPSAGKLISIISDRNNRSSAAVTYFADPDSGATMDSFSFVARYPGGKFSGLARCDIQIQDVQNLVEVAPEVDFGKIMVGSGAEKEIVVLNRGNGLFNTTLNLPPPWTVMSPPGGQLVIAPGNQATIKVGFAPTFPGPASYHLPLGSGEKGMCKLSGEGSLPFSFEAEESELTLNPRTGRREARIVVLNHHSRPLEAFLRTSSRLQTQIQGMFYLLPGKENVIEVFLNEDDVMSFEGGIEIRLKEGFTSMGEVVGKTIPAQLKVEIPEQISQEVINFGKVIAGRSIERGVILKNIGGELLAIDGEVEEPFRILTRLDRQLVPLESYPVSIGFYPAPEDRGAADKVLNFFGKDKALQIRLVGNAMRPPHAPRDPLVTSPPLSGASTSRTDLEAALPEPEKSGTTTTPEIGSGRGARPSPEDSPDRLIPSLPPAPRKEDSVGPSRVWDEGMSREDFLKTLSPLGIPTRSLVERERSPDLKCAEDFQLLKSKSNLLELGWTAPKDSEIDSFDLEMRGEIIDPQSKSSESVWAPYPNVKYDRVGRLVKAKVTQLSPNTHYEFRVFTVNSNGRSSPPSVSFTTSTTRTMDWTYIYLSLGVIALLLLGLGLFKIIRDRRAEIYHSPLID